MQSIAARSAAAPVLAAATPTTTNAVVPAPSAGSGDALDEMRPAMDAVLSIGVPMNADQAGSVLAAGGSYIAGATRTLSKLDDGIRQRSERLEQLRATDPKAAEQEEGQLDLLQRLRDRIQLSIERVGDILAGRDRGDVEGGASHEDQLADIRARGARRHQERDEELALLEQRQRLLAPSVDTQLREAPAPALVASRYAQASGAA